MNKFESFLAPNLGVLNNIEKTRENRNFEPEPEMKKTYCNAKPVNKAVLKTKKRNRLQHQYHIMDQRICANTT